MYKVIKHYDQSFFTDMECQGIAVLQYDLMGVRRVVLTPVDTTWLTYSRKRGRITGIWHIKRVYEEV